MTPLADLGFDRVSIGAQSAEPTERVMAEARLRLARSTSTWSTGCRSRRSTGSSARSTKCCGSRRSASRSTATRTASAELKLQLLTLAIGRLTRAGYLYIGMEH